jgi:hypothetical protein
MSPQKLLFCYHLPTWGRVGVKLGDAWYVSTISIIFDAPCLFIHHLFYVLLHFMAFYAFSRTNLLTRRHSASSLFSSVFVFQKSYTGNILGIRQNKSQSSYFPDMRRSPKQRRRGTRGQAHHGVARPSPWLRHQVVWPPSPPPDAALPPIYSPRQENLKSSINFHKTYCKPPPSSMRDREGLEALPGTLSERGITTGGLLHHHACLRSDVWVVYLGLWVYSSS